jgi:hypothetical protein
VGPEHGAPDGSWRPSQDAAAVHSKARQPDIGDGKMLIGYGCVDLGAAPYLDPQAMQVRRA